MKKAALAFWIFSMVTCATSAQARVIKCDESSPRLSTSRVVAQLESYIDHLPVSPEYWDLDDFERLVCAVTPVMGHDQKDRYYRLEPLNLTYNQMLSNFRVLEGDTFIYTITTLKELNRMSMVRPFIEGLIVQLRSE